MEGASAEVKVPLLKVTFSPQDATDPESQEEVSCNIGADTHQDDEVLNNELGFESLDYDPIFSVVFENMTKSKRARRVYGYTGVTLAKWSITILIGILVGLVAYVIESSQEYLVTRKKKLTQENISHGLALTFLGYSSFSISLVLVASCLVIFWAPAAAGGGVTLVMAYLNGTDIPDFFKFRTLVTKIIGSICSISSGLLLGQEGPMVHIGAAIASLLTWMHGTFPSRKKETSDLRLCCNKLRPKGLPFEFHSDKDRREFISAGTAAGLAAAFGAPIGGVLYSLEEASSFWSRKVMWRSLLCCTFATMVLALINSWEFSASLPGSMSFRGLQPAFIVRDLPFFVVTSALTGILGAFVNIAHGWLDKLRPPSTYKFLRILEACSVAFVSITLMFVLPLYFGQCLPVPDEKTSSGTMDKDYWFQYTCPKENSETGVPYYNDVATLFFSLPRKSMQELYQLQGHRESDFTIQSLGIHSISVLIMFILAYGIATPGGIFMPAMLVGASFGAFFGRILEAMFPSANIQPGLHALVGTASMLGGVFRASISLVVILVEGTGGIDFILPIIIGIVVSNWVAHHVHHAGAYESDLERLGGVCFLQSEPPRELIGMSASDLMSLNVVCFPEIVPVAEILEVLRNTRHNGFPVLRHSNLDNLSGGRFVGLILRHQLLLLLEQRAFVEVDSTILSHPKAQKFLLCEKKISKEMRFLERAIRVYHHCHYPYRRYLSSRPEALDYLDLDDILQTTSRTNTNLDTDAEGDPRTVSGTPNAFSNSDTKVDTDTEDIRTVSETPKNLLAVDLRLFMNRAPITVRRECSAQRVYHIFRTLGLRHLCVTDSHNRVIGIITRNDIAVAHKQEFVSKSRKAFHHWDSDIRSFNESSREDKKDRERMFNLP